MKGNVLIPMVILSAAPIYVSDTKQIKDAADLPVFKCDGKSYSLGEGRTSILTAFQVEESGGRLELTGEIDETYKNSVTHYRWH